MTEPLSRSSFGEVLRRYRLAAGFSQDELAQRANVSLAAVSALERGARRAPQRQTLNMLLDGLDLGPAERAELQEAASRSRARTRGTLGAAAAVVTATKHTNVPPYLTSFVAREAEINEVRNLTHDYRLVTIVGAGGIGKTRLACEIANRSTDLFDLVVFADLAPLIEGEMLVPYLASVLQPEAYDGRSLDEVVSTLTGKRAFVILDNCERLLEAAAFAVTALLKACPELTILATSRERLAISGESIFRLQSLDVPSAGTLALVEAQGAAALQLFVQRAQAIEPGFSLGKAELADVVDICHRLDGIPLAIELAVARLPSLGLRQLCKRLDQQFAASVGYRDVPARHQTMQATIAWSFDLLDDDERTLISRAGIFAGGFTLEAAELVCGDDNIHAAAVVDVLSRLVEKSLLLVHHDSGESRYRLLESVRLYSLQQLRDARAFDAISRRHATWLACRGDAANLEIRGGYTSRTITLGMLAEIDNIRTALERLLASGHADDVVLAARIAGGLRLVWIGLRLSHEGLRWATEILAKLDADRHPELSALVLRLQIQAGPQPPKRILIEQAVRVFSRIEDYYALSTMYITVLTSAGNAGDFELCEMAAREAGQLFASEHALGDHFHAWFLSARAYVEAVQGRFDDARASDAAAAIIAGADPHAQLDRRQVLALIEAIAGNYAYAIKLQSEALTTTRYDVFDLEQAYANRAIFHFLNGAADEATVDLRLAMECGQFIHRSQLEDILLVSAAIAAHRGSMEIAARIKGSYDRYATASKGTYRNPLELRVIAHIEAAFGDRSNFREHDEFAASGARMSIIEVRALVLSL